MDTEPSIFTRIINRELPATIIYEDATVLAFFTIEPVNPGHTLVVPKVPFVNVFDGSPKVLGHMMQVGQKIAQAFVTAGIGDGANLVMNNGEAGGQEVFHAHLHVIPRRSGDGAFLKPHHQPYAVGEEAQVAASLQSILKD